MEQISLSFVIAMIVAYLLGNISPSTILGRMHGIDIKKEGSGNAGATNTLRVLGPRAAAVTFLVDVMKGVMAVILAEQMAGPAAGRWACLFVMLGHVWPVVLRFRGGKGVAVSFGAILAVNWKLALLLLLIVVVAVVITRKVSFGSIAACVSFPVLGYFLEREFMPVGVIMALIILYAHRSNIGRLMRGEENSIHFSRKKEDHQS
ncbi:acyl-phosphate glycerol-3-phosphate acyltransferase [Eubacterium pyruvativorans]|uniref:Glycerol-3-phosphate acyltransferase n=1 Tax=Eubacterium pyruvativorans TaxID=155865 RepID=A0A1I7F4S7_9FIRM|nr:glycerol-3-phosphate 1-O-acyltransferase PlsY [Eubacterium pyruvativorans]MDD6707842.1 glycerol-3-phosphate 1-O-acyltransferase PlsY [Eubacterium pyruvativorans]SFO05079.1 acyl-phosphate glycerol-3-phosphate acyltransferase [Eubacterium pyruvativorans]SFU31183.1 acyl-phosphate glycerol-3-phosphate acyltransferase [Eubacterium pyruvativorans]